MLIKFRLNGLEMLPINREINFTPDEVTEELGLKYKNSVFSYKT